MIALNKEQLDNSFAQIVEFLSIIFHNKILGNRGGAGSRCSSVGFDRADAAGTGSDIMLQAVLLICMQGEVGDLDPVFTGRLLDGLPFFRLDFLSINAEGYKGYGFTHNCSSSCVGVLLTAAEDARTAASRSKDRISLCSGISAA